MAASRRLLCGDKLRYQREERVWTQEVLAEAAGVTVGTISRLETGYHHARPSTIQKLVKALDCSPADLLEWIPNDNGHGLASMALAATTILSSGSDILT
jgi:transcriptional regulator with XRE-family HTH domain